MKLKASPSCDRCSHPYENLLHLLYESPRTQTFWQMVIAWWNEKRSESVALNATVILYGEKLESNLFQALNHFVIIAKYHIYLSWLNKASPRLEIFSLLLNDRLLLIDEIQSKMDNTVCMSCMSFVSGVVSLPLPFFSFTFCYF